VSADYSRDYAKALLAGDEAGMAKALANRANKGWGANGVSND